MMNSINLSQISSTSAYSLTRGQEVKLIIAKAIELGLKYKLTENHQWKIYLKENYVLSETEAGWRLSVEGNFEIDLCHSGVLEFLEDLK